MAADPSHPVQVTAPPGSHGVYFVKYLDGKTNNPPAVVDTLKLVNSTPVDMTHPTETLAYARPAIFDEAVYHDASIVGAIADLNHLGANRFAFIDTADPADTEVSAHPASSRPPTPSSSATWPSMA